MSGVHRCYRHEKYEGAFIKLQSEVKNKIVNDNLTKCACHFIILEQYLSSIQILTLV